MKLLRTPKSQAMELAKQNNTLIEKGVKIAMLVDRNEKRLNETKDDLEWKMGKFQEEFDEFFADLTILRQKLVDSVSEAEGRKKSALESLDNVIQTIASSREHFLTMSKMVMDGIDRQNAELSIKISNLSQVLEKMDAVVERSVASMESMGSMDLELNRKITVLSAISSEIDRKIALADDRILKMEDSLAKRETLVFDREIANSKLWVSLEEVRKGVSEEIGKLRDAQHALRLDYDQLRKKQ